MTYQYEESHIKMHKFMLICLIITSEFYHLQIFPVTHLNLKVKSTELVGNSTYCTCDACFLVKKKLNDLPDPCE
jgi:hypothetical protein